MALATAKLISVTSVTTSANYDILKDPKILPRIQNVYPEFPNVSIPIYLEVFLPTGDVTQIKINDGEWDDFLVGASYDTQEVTNIKSAVLSANGCHFHAIISFQ